jgi:cysteine desulfurase
MSERRTVYLDYNATTPLDPRVADALSQATLEFYANPSSPHVPGRRAATALRAAREQVASAVNALPDEIVFTSGATESNNLAILGCARAVRDRRTILVSAVEHKSVLEPARTLRAHGFRVVEIPVRSSGVIDSDALAKALDQSVFLVSVQLANNEVGAIQPLAQVADLAHSVGALVHSDAAQALGRVTIDVHGSEVDLISLSSHKCYGPRGIGVLLIRGGARRSGLVPLFVGGGQEFELRPGTENVPSVVAFARACELAASEVNDNPPRISTLRDRLEGMLLRQLPGARSNTAGERRLSSTISLFVPGCDAEAVIANLPDVAISGGSACSSGGFTPSHVLRAMGRSACESASTLRISVGRFTTDADVDYAAQRISSVVRKLSGYSIPSYADAPEIIDHQPSQYRA